MSPQRPEPGAAERQQLDSESKDWAVQEVTRNHADTPAPADQEVWPDLAVQEVRRDYLVCKYFDSNGVYGDPVNVAKHPELRGSFFHDKTIDGKTYSISSAQRRTVLDEESQVSLFEEISPKYFTASDGEGDFIGSIIIAAPQLSKVRNDADDGDVWCQLHEITPRIYITPGALPAPTAEYQTLVAMGQPLVWTPDWVRAHPPQGT